MQNLAKIVTPAKLGDCPEQCSLAHPDGSGMTTRGEFLNGQCQLTPNLEKPEEGPCSALVSLSYLLPDFSYQVSGTVQAIGNRAAFIGQLVVQRNADGLTPMQCRQKIKGGEKINVGEFTTTQWGVVEPISITESPTFNFITQLIRDHLPRMFQRMKDLPQGDDVTAMMHEFFEAKSDECCGQPETCSGDAEATSEETKPAGASA